MMWEYSSCWKEDRISMLRGAQKAASVKPTRSAKQALLAVLEDILLSAVLFFDGEGKLVAN